MAKIVQNSPQPQVITRNLQTGVAVQGPTLLVLLERKDANAILANQYGIDSVVAFRLFRHG